MKIIGANITKAIFFVDNNCFAVDVNKFFENEPQYCKNYQIGNTV